MNPDLKDDSGGCAVWDSGGPDSELMRLIESGKIPIERAIDLGCGSGHDAIYLRQQGFNVTAVDISSSAVEIAKENAKKAGVKGIDFRVCDALFIKDPHGSFTFINDRGCFHSLPPASRSSYVSLVRKLLLPRGHLFLRTFSKLESGGPGPYHFSEEELAAYFVPCFAVMEFKEGEFGVKQRRRLSVCLLRKI
jgi:SAM-dependent methyltransferase